MFRKTLTTQPDLSKLIKNGEIDEIKLLISSDPKIVDSEGMAALHAAAMCGRLEIAELLLEVKPELGKTVDNVQDNRSYCGGSIR